MAPPAAELFLGALVPGDQCRRPDDRGPPGRTTRVTMGKDSMVATESDSRELMAGQLGVWNAQQLAPESVAFLVSEYHDIHGDLDVGLLVQAIRRTLDEAEAYRLRFRVVDGAPR